MHTSINLFLDTEFTNFEFLQLISMGIVSDRGHEFYTESSDYKLDDCSEFVQEVVVPKLSGGEHASSETTIMIKLSDWLLELVNSYDQVKVYMDYHGDLIILDRLLKGFPAKAKLSCILIDLKHLEDKVNIEERQYQAHHALWDAKDLYARWNLAAKDN